MRYLLRTFPFLLFIVLLVACDSAVPPCGASAELTTLCSPQPDATVSGVVTAPLGVDVAGTEVRACGLSGNTVTCVDAPSTLITGSGSNAPYKVADLSAGEYAVIAFLDVDGDDTEEYRGVYGGSQQFVAVTPPASNIDIQLYPASNVDASRRVSNLKERWRFPKD